MNKFLQHIENAFQRFKEWKNDDICVVFPIITDLHSALETVDSLNSQKRECVSHIAAVNAAAEMFSADLTANLGDCGVDVPLKEPQDINTLIERIKDLYEASQNKPALHIIGNHDIMRGVAPQRWGKIMQDVNAGIDGMNSQADGTYGYYDIKEKKTRIFYLFCNETEQHHSEMQLEFVQSNLQNLPQDWCAAVLQHICIRPIGRWQKREGMPEFPKFVRLQKIFSDFVKEGGKLVGVISGDSHFNLFENADGVNYYSCQGYGGIGPQEAPRHALLVHEFCPALGRTDSFDSDKVCLIDVVAFKPEKREAAIFRIGAGSDDFNRHFNF